MVLSKKHRKTGKITEQKKQFTKELLKKHDPTKQCTKNEYPL